MTIDICRCNFCESDDFDNKKEVEEKVNDEDYEDN